VDRERKLGALPRLTSLRHLDIDGFTDLQPPELVQLGALQELETLILRNSAFLHAADLTSLAPLSRLQRLDFSLHADYKDLAEDEGENDGPDAPLEGEDWQFSKPLCALASLKQLKDLDLGDRSSLHLSMGENLMFLTQLSSLTKLNLKNCLNKLTTPLSQIARLPMLQALNIEGYSGGSFHFLHSLPHLRHVCLRNCSGLSDSQLQSLCSELLGLSIVDVLDCPDLSYSGVSLSLQKLPCLWAVALPGHTLDLTVVDQLAKLPELRHLLVSRPSRAVLDGVNCGAVHGGLGGRKRHISGDLVRRFLEAELPGKIREHLKFYRSGFLDHADWDKWWVSEEEYDDEESDRDMSDSETDDSDNYSDSEDDSESGDDDNGLPWGPAMWPPQPQHGGDVFDIHVDDLDPLLGSSSEDDGSEGEEEGGGLHSTDGDSSDHDSADDESDDDGGSSEPQESSSDDDW